MVEHTAVNRAVAGSSPARGGWKHWETVWKEQGREAAMKMRLHGQVVKTPPFHGGNTGSNPVGVITDRLLIECYLKYAVVAQLAEQLICNQQVTGSSPVNGLAGTFSSVG